MLQTSLFFLITSCLKLISAFDRIVGGVVFGGIPRRETFVRNKVQLLHPLEAVKHSKREGGSYCIISGSEPLSATFHKLAMKARHSFCNNFKNLLQCNLNKILKNNSGYVASV